MKTKKKPAKARGSKSPKRRKVRTGKAKTVTKTVKLSKKQAARVLRDVKDKASELVSGAERAASNLVESLASAVR
jgi:hypothetical protein